jgi:selenocysteine lyase/cysteine desulfurase
MIVDDYVRAIGLPSGGAVRASLGLASNFADVYRFMRFAAEFVDLRDVPGNLPPRTTC